MYTGTGGTTCGWMSDMQKLLGAKVRVTHTIFVDRDHNRTFLANADLHDEDAEGVLAQATAKPLVRMLRAMTPLRHDGTKTSDLSDPQIKGYEYRWTAETE